MPVYVNNPTIEWYDAHHTEIIAKWRSPWYNSGRQEDILRDWGIDHYEIIWSEYTIGTNGYHAVKTENIPASQAGMPDYYMATMSPSVGKGTTMVKAAICAIPKTDLSECQQADLYGSLFDPKHPDWLHIQMSIGWSPPKIENAPTLEWIDNKKTGFKLVLSDYDPAYDTDDVWIAFVMLAEFGTSNGPYIKWNRRDDYIEYYHRSVVPGMGKIKYRAKSYYSNDGRFNVGAQSAEWSPWSEELLMPPDAPTKITVSAIPTDSNPNLLKVVIEERETAHNFTDHYEVEYTTNASYFDSGYGTTTVSSQDDSNIVIINPGESGGGTFYFRARIVNETGPGAWTYSNGATSVGKEPDAPTTWTYTNSFVGGDDQYIIFYWTHNTRDGSTQRAAKITIVLNNTTTITFQWPGVTYNSSSTYKEGDFVNYQNQIYRCIYDINTPEAWNPSHWDYVGDGLPSDGVYSYKFPVFQYGQGGVTSIKWSVKTRGVMTTGGPDNDGFSKSSTVREVKVYQQPTVNLLLNSYNIRSYPINIRCVSSPSFQNPISYTFTIKAKEAYETAGFDGETVNVSENQIIYTKYGSFPDDSINNPHDFYITLNAGDVHLENGIIYSLEMSMGFDSGLTAEAYTMVTINYSNDSKILPMANVYINKESYTSTISPVAYDMSKEFVDDNPVIAENVLLSVYRKEYNGEMTLIQDGINNVRGVAVTDPHPSLKSSTYRIMAVNTVNGMIYYNDINTEGINDPCIVIQWDEEYRYIEGAEQFEEPLDNPLYQGTFLRLPFNIKLGESSDADINNVKYIGRKRPVSYFGTQLGETASWTCEFDKTDEETIYKLRKLSTYMGNVYVREPMGLGYWAVINVSFNRDYDNLVIPVKLEVTRVEGGGRP